MKIAGIKSETVTLSDCEELYSYGIITEISNGQIIKFGVESEK